MKKWLSFVLTITMLASMMSVPMAVGAQSYAEIDLSSGFVADTSFANNCTESAVYGIAGKDAADESVGIKEYANTWTSWYQYNHGEELYLENGEHMEGYLVAELNFMAPDADYLAEFIFGVSTNQARMTVNPTAALKANPGRWNHLRMVYWADETNCDFIDFENNIPNAVAKLGSTVLYLNGEEIGTKDITCTATQYSSPIDTMLLEVYSADKTVQHATYYDDIKIYKSAVNPGAPENLAVAATSEYTVADGTITIAAGAQVTASDIAAANIGYEIIAFDSNALSVQLESTANLAVGNCVVAKSPDGVYTYYDVADVSTNVLFAENDGSFESVWCKKMTQETVSGVAGKALTDESVLFTTDLSTFDGNMMLNKDNYYTKSKNYFVIEANINPVDGEYDMSNVTVNTNSHATVGSAVVLETNKWNKYLMYVDFTAETPKAYTYVNGAFVKENDVPATFGSQSTVRLCFNGDKENPKSYSVYVDDFKIYETNNKPAGTTETVLPAPASNANYSLSSGKLNVLPGTTAAQVRAANANARIFTDASCSEYAADDAVMQNGMVFALDNSYKAVGAYPVVISYGEVEIDLRTGDDGAAFPTVANGSGETVSGFAGKDASDKILAVTANTDTHIALKSWGTVVKTGSDNSVTPSWSKTDYNGYLVAEASIFNIDNTTIALVTTQTGQVSGNVAAYIPANEWARVKFVYNAVDGDANEGKTMTYVNGKAVTGWINSVFGKMAAYSTNNYMCNDIRISMKGSTSGVAATYIDDIRVYEIPALRAEEAVAFTAPEGAFAIGDAFSYVDGAVITAQQLRNANPDVTVKVFNNKKDYTEITDSSATLADGNVIFVSDMSQSTVDAGFGYNDLFRVLTVGKLSPTKDVLTSLPTSVSRCDISDVSGAFENTADVKKITDTSTSDSNWYFAHGYNGTTEGMKYLVYEVDFAPTEDVKDIYFGANQHAALSATMNVGNQLAANRWNKIVMIYDVANDTSDLYINGTLVSDDYAGNYAEKMAANNGTIEFRFIVDCKMGAVSYIDTYKLYESAVYPEIAQPVLLADGYENRILANYVAGTADINEAVTVADIASNVEGGTAYAFEDSTYGTLLGDTDTFNAGNVLVLKTDDNMFTVYNVTTHKSDNIIASGDTYDGAGNMTTGTLGLYAPVSDGGVLFAAQYDEDGKLIKLAMDKTVENNTLAIDFETEEIDKTKVKALLFDSVNSLKPLCKGLEIDVRDYINFLILGNSYSMDVTWHLRQIAAADDVLMNISVLNKGGSPVSYHYENREVPVSQSEINFWYNNKTLGKSNLKIALEEYDWDYVAIQNSSTTKGIDDTSDENYETYWAVMADLAEYIHDREPDARIAIHSTWSMETGYNFVDSDETRNQIMANFRTISSRVVNDINTRLGLAGDDEVLVISSTDILDAARSYAPEQDVTINGRTCAVGTKLFDTTYYKDGHVFTFTEANVRDVAVGDGTMLLSDEDSAAGKISLHRDGFHMSALGRYLIALNAYATLTGNKVTGNTFDSADATRADGTIRLDSSPGGLHVTETDTNISQTVFQIYDILTPEVRSICQQLVDGLER